MTVRLVGRTGKARGIDRAVGDLLTVGSAAGNELRLESRSVSRQHAQIVKSGERFFVEDLGSRNGTFLNGQQVKRFPLRHLDVLSIGPEVDLIFLETSSVLPPPVARPAPPRATIVWSVGPFAGRVEEVPPDRGLVLGRGANTELAGAISRQHAVVTIRGDHVTVEDLASANGTWVNGQRISAVTRLADRDEVSLANLIKFRVIIVSDAAAPAVVTGEQEPVTVVLRPSRARDSPALDMRPMGAPGSPSSAAVPTAAPRPELGRGAAPARLEGAPILQAPVPQAPGASGTTPIAREAAQAPPALREVPTEGATVIAPREAAESPPVLRESLPEGATVIAPREAATAPPVPGMSPPQGVSVSAPLDAPQAPVVAIQGPQADGGLTGVLPRGSAGGVPTAVFAEAVGARDAAPTTVRVRDTAVSEKGGQPPAPPATTEAALGRRTNIVGVRLDGPHDITLNRGEFSVGRDALCDIRIDSRDVGRRHARIRVSEDDVVVCDLNTSNGTFVNDVRVVGEFSVPDGAHLRFATVEYTVTFLSDEGSQ